jgi:hypothetical protein
VPREIAGWGHSNYSEPVVGRRDAVPLNQEDWIMAIKKLVRDTSPGAAPGATKELTMPAFSFSPNTGLAELIVEAWTNRDFRDKLLERDAAKKVTEAAAQLATAAVNARGFNLKRAVVISEKEHDSDYTSPLDSNEVVFVLPDNGRLEKAFVPNSSLLDTARLLMACTPNGI